jgi:hypothetical protein
MRFSWMVETRVEMRNERLCFVRPSSARKRSRERKKTRTPSGKEQSGGTTSGEYAEDGECLAVTFRTASVWL